MVPNVTRGGASFKGAAAYYLHDKDALSADRVAWTETVNLITREPEKAARVMAATAIAQNELKAEAAKESLKALGVEDRQALIVCHTDEPHAHVHVIVNRVSMADGRAADMRGDYLKLSRWAEDWEQRHGKIWCAERVRNNERRDQGELVRGSTNVPRSVFEALRDGTKGLNDNRDAQLAAAELRAEQQRKAAELTAQGREMHRAYREELSGLAADYRRDTAKIIEAGREERRQLREQSRAAFQQTKAELLAGGAQNGRRRRGGSDPCSGAPGMPSMQAGRPRAWADGSAERFGPRCRGMPAMMRCGNARPRSTDRPSPRPAA